MRVLNFHPRPHSICRMCDGSGWRLVMIDTNGDHRVTRCECRQPKEATSKKRNIAAAMDHKSAAAGDR